MMERIVLEVDSRLAKKWQEATATKRNKIVAFVKSALELLDESAGGPIDQAVPDRAAKLEYLKELNEFRAEAAANGLTPKKLGEIMEWDEDTMKNLFGEVYE